MRNIDKEQASVMASSWLLNCNILFYTPRPPGLMTKPR